MITIPLFTTSAVRRARSPLCSAFLLCAASFAHVGALAAGATPTRVGFVLHFDHFSSSTEALALIQTARAAGANAMNVVPPSHIWESPADLTVLDQIVDALEDDGLTFMISRVDAMYLPTASNSARHSWLYANLLTEPGRLPDSTATQDWFRATVNVPGYAQWMKQETAFYAKRYGRRAGLLGFNVGALSEPFVSQRGSFFAYSMTDKIYEIAQYTPHAQRWWSAWLKHRWRRVRALNQAYGTRFKSFKNVPMPVNEKDARFANAPAAYSDFVRSLNAWFVGVLNACQREWRRGAGPRQAPLILQMSGYDAEKFMLGRPAFWELQWPRWLEQTDAVGLSIYTNDGYLDYGHASIGEMVRALKTIAGASKSILVMESGCEAPYPTLNTDEWKFIADAAARLTPKTFFYEFLKVPYYNTVAPRDGHCVWPDGTVNAAVMEKIPALFDAARSTAPVETTIVTNFQAHVYNAIKKP